MPATKHRITKRMFADTMVVMIISGLTGAISCFIDGLITGRFLGNECMAAFGYSCTYFSIIAIINGILMVGNQTLCLQEISKGNKTNVCRLITLSTIYSIAITSLIAVIILVFPRQTATLFGVPDSNEAIMTDVTQYLKGVCLGAPFWCWSIVLTPIVQLDGGTKAANAAAVGTAVTDIVFDYVLGVMLKFGMFGMGLATTLGQMAGCIITVAHFFTKKASYRFTFKDICFDKTAAIMKEGLPRATSMIARTIGPVILNIIIAGISTEYANGMAALSVQRSVSFFATCIGWGISSTVLMLGTLFYNERNISEMKALIRYSLISIACLVGLFSLISIVTTPFTVRLFQPDWTNNTDLYKLTQIALFYFFASLPFVAFNNSFASYVQSVGKNLSANIINAFIECISLVAACYVLSVQRQYEGFFAGFLYGQAALSLALILYIVIYRTIHRKEKYSLYLIEKDYIKDNEKTIQSEINTYEDAEKMSSEAMNLCLNAGLSEQHAYKVGLCVEELAVNILDHGMKKDNKKHIVEMNVAVDENKAVITLIDNCRKFDVSKKLKSLEIDSAHPEKNIGIRMVMLLAKQVIYSNTINMNHLQIII